jgi:hypothetical protein
MRDSELLNAVGRLFQSPIRDALDNEARSHFKQIAVDNASRHPFVAFFNRFPDDAPPKDKGSPETKWPQRAKQYFHRLNSWLDENGSSIRLDLQQPQKIVQGTRSALNYAAFYRDWKEKHRREDDEHGGMYCPGDDKPRMKWVAVLRGIIKDRYPP